MHHFPEPLYFITTAITRPGIAGSRPSRLQANSELRQGVWHPSQNSPRGPSEKMGKRRCTSTSITPIFGSKAVKADWGPGQGDVTNPAFRYSLEKLSEVLRKQSDISFDASTAVLRVHLYGSKPCPEDYWKMLQKKTPGLKINVFDRSLSTGKEKQVDMQMGCDITAQAIIDNVHKHQSEYIIVTGDVDFLPAIKKVIKCRFQPHVWAWRASVADAFYRHPKIKLRYLDDVRRDFDHIAVPINVGQPCAWNYYCKDTHEYCSGYHPPEEVAYFKSNGGPKPHTGYMKTVGEDTEPEEEDEQEEGELLEEGQWTARDLQDQVCETCGLRGAGHGVKGSLRWRLIHGDMSGNW